MARSRPVARRRCLKGHVLRWFGMALGCLPATAIPRLGRWLAHVEPLVRRRRRIAARNLALAFPLHDDATHARLLRKTLASSTTGGLDTLRAWFAPAGRLDGLGRIDGMDVLEAAIGEGRGAVLIGAHYDSIELAIRLVADAAHARGIRTAVLVRRYNDPCLEAAIDAGRLRYLSATIDKKDITGFCAAVGGGGAVFYVPDQDAGPRGVFVPFFGIQASTVAAMPGVLHRAGGIPLLVWSSRGDDGRLAIDIERAPAGFLDGDGVQVAARYTAWVERRVRAAPAQYLWVHRRYKTRPAGEADAYAP
ncbi:MAG TPA: hypothetical protein VFM73_06690 [Xanthomonadaceae bacterium]|nr:hypothetical protein [Xanthomonadaceae bacterium]